MHTYEVTLRPDIRLARRAAEPLLTRDMLLDALPGATILALSEQQWGPRVLNVRLERQSHEDTLQEIREVAARFGFALVEAIVSEWTDDAAERAVRWILGDGAVDAAASDPVVGVAAFVIGAIAGAAAGNAEKQLVKRYEAHSLRYGWSLRELQLPAAGQRPQPGFSAA